MPISPRNKSPKAPTIALEQALERVFRVYEQERLHAAPVDAVAQAIGFKNANSGSSSATIASLCYFGLMTRPKDGFLAVSRDVELYKFALDGKVKMEMVLDFLKTPPLYQALLEKHSSGLPSSAKLKAELLQRGFLPQAVDTVLSAFLQSVSFAQYFDTLSNVDLPLAPPSEREVIDIDAIEEQSESKEEAQPQLNSNRSSATDQIPIRLSGGRRAWLNIPTPFYESDKARIKAQIDVLYADADE